MNLKEIKAAVDAGKTVHWASDAYTVVNPTGRPDGYFIGYMPGTVHEHYIGLTWRDGVTVNGKPEQFYVAIEVKS